MASLPNLIGIEIIVADLDTAAQFCERALGLVPISRGPSPDVLGEVAVFALGNAAITLLQPASGGDGPLVGKRDPRVSQVFLGLPPDELAPAAEHLVDAGVPVHVLETGRFFVPAATVTGAFGIESAITVLAVDESLAADADADGPGA